MINENIPDGSLRVKRGDKVKRGQLIGQVGNSGDSRWPHLHFQLTNKVDLWASEGLPFVIDHFRMTTIDGSWSERRNEFPWGDETVIDFGEFRDRIQTQNQVNPKTRPKINTRK